MEVIVEIQIPNYQEVEVIKDHTGMYYLMMGDNYVLFNKEQWQEFKKAIASAE
jgi:hypothetical protein